MLLGVIAFSLNDKMIMFDRMREKIRAKYNLNDFHQIKDAANESVRTLIKRSIMTSGMLIISAAILMAFTNIVSWATGMTLLLGLAFNLVTTSFVLPMVWTKLEIIRQKGIVRRTKNNFWDTKSVEEQIIVGINDYRH